MKTHFYTFLAFFLFGNLLFAQAPGGVSTNLTMWVRSNSGTSTTTNGNPVTGWTYANDGSKSFAGLSGHEPTFSSNSVNFFPTLSFNGSQMDGPTGANAPLAAGDDDYAIFGVWFSNSIAGYQRIWTQTNTFGSGDGTALWINKFSGTQYGNQPEISPFTQGAQQNFVLNKWNISQLNLLNVGTNDLEIIDQTNFGTTPLVLSNDGGGNANTSRNLGNAINRIGARTGFSDEPLSGNIAELFVYSGPVSGAQRSQIFSYLAMKYGITLGTNLVSSSSTVVWNATTNATYNNAVFGLAQDDNSGLIVSQSNSIVTGSGNGAGQSGAANIVLSNPSALSNNDFLIIGNDNAAVTETSTDLPVSASGSKRIVREWKAQHTNNVGTVNVGFDLTGLTITGTIGTTTDFRLMVDADGDGDFTTGTIRYYTPTSFTGNVANFTGVTLNNGEVFTFITKSVPFTLPVTWKDVNVKLVNSNEAELTWKVANNENAASYEIEHSLTGANYQKVGVVRNNPSVQSYSFTHRGLTSGTHYYRIHQVDNNGLATYSNVLSIQVRGVDVTVNLFNNPVKGSTVPVIINAAKSTKANIEVWTINGTKISTISNASVIAGTNRIDVPAEKLSTGNYIMKVMIEDQVYSLRFVKL